MSGAQALPAHMAKRSAFASLLLRDLRLGLHRPVEVVTPVSFCLVVTALFALGVGPESSTLRAMAPGVVWATALLAMVISVETVFSSDHEDGTLEQMLVSPGLLPALVLAKVLARWIWTALPLVAVSPLLGVMLGLGGDALPALSGSLLLGTPTLFLLGAFGSALLVGQRHGSALLALLVLPLCVPVLIFAAGLVRSADLGLPSGGAASLLGAMLALALTFLPLATAWVLGETGSGR